MGQLVQECAEGSWALAKPNDITMNSYAPYQVKHDVLGMSPYAMRTWRYPEQRSSLEKY